MLTERLELRPLPQAAAAALPGDRDAAARMIGAKLSDEWPQPDVLDVLPRHSGLDPSSLQFGVWLIIERASDTVIGDIGFFGPPGEERTIEIGYGVVPEQQRRGYATEAAGALAGWALRQPGVDAVVARCDVDNQASIRTLERAGFERIGEDGGQLRWRR
ncbi:MAG TPA: GNAT family protein [Solirubrobacteraceae bacterium]|jgi:ribosomal-protein-alanine N-acetyltransferase|nr:GNAT family protein [Solirubrobacteraceae bacterium]